MTRTSFSRRAFAATLCHLAAFVFAGDGHARDGRPPQPPAAPNAVVHWNAVASEVFAPSQGTNPMAQSRTLAILHASVHDALNAIDRRYAPHTPGLAPAPGASPDAAVAAAAREVLVQLVPDQAARVEAAYGQALARVRDRRAKAAGLATGQAAAWATLNRRRDDGADAAGTPYLPRPGAGEYQFTAPFDFAAQPGWGRVRPFAIELADHDVEPPLPLDGAAYARDLAEVRAVGHVASTVRSPEQGRIANFWYEDSPLGWNRIANAAVRQRGLDAWDAARTFALLHFAMADGFVAGFEAKYRHRFWRPVTALHAAGDVSWAPLLVTPPVPDHPSTHTVLGWAAADVLARQLGHRVRFEATSLTLPGHTRRFRGFAEAAHENGLSRLYAGIHFRHAIREGRRLGRSIADAVNDALPPVHR